MKRRQVLVLAGVGLAGAAAGVAWSLRRSAPSLDDAENALWATALPRPDGGTLAMASLRGKPLLVNFWATWCAPCLKEMPLLDRFHREKQASGWTVVGVAVDSLEPVREYLTRLPVGFPIGLAGMGGAELSRQLGNAQGALPFTAVFDRRGKIFDRHLGAVDEARLERWERAQAMSA